MRPCRGTRKGQHPHRRTVPLPAPPNPATSHSRISKSRTTTLAPPGWARGVRALSAHLGTRSRAACSRSEGSMQRRRGGCPEPPGPRRGGGAKSASRDSGQPESFHRRGRREAVQGGRRQGAALGVGEGRGGAGGGARRRGRGEGRVVLQRGGGGGKGRESAGGGWGGTVSGVGIRRGPGKMKGRGGWGPRARGRGRALGLHLLPRLPRRAEGGGRRAQS